MGELLYEFSWENTYELVTVRKDAEKTFDDLFTSHPECDFSVYVTSMYDPNFSVTISSKDCNTLPTVGELEEKNYEKIDQ